MADEKLDRWLEQAQKAYAQRDKRVGSQMVDKILHKDFNHPGAWDLLYKLYGGAQTYDDFRRSFTKKYYPDKAHLLIPAGQAPVHKPSFLGRLFGRTAKQPEGQAAEPLPSPLTGEPPAAPTPDESEIHPSIRPAGQAERRAVPLSLLQSAPAPGERPPGGAITPLPTKEPEAAEALVRQGKIRLMVADDVPQTRENIIRTLRFQDDIEVVETASNGSEAIRLARESKPDVILMDINMPELDGITATATLRREAPKVQVIILTVQDDADYIRRAMLAGACDYLIKPPMIDDLVGAIHRAADTAFEEKKKAAASLARTQTEQAPKGKVITIYSPRGGSGCTMLAANLAAVLHNPESTVAVVDGNLQFGDIPVLFNLRAKNTIRDLAPRADEMDAELVHNVMTPHPSGIHILAPTRPEQAEIVTGPQFTTLLKALAGLYSYVIVDSVHRLSEITLAAFDASDLIVVVSTQDVPGIARIHKFLDLAPRINLEMQRLLVVMNLFDPRMGITTEKVSESFKQPIAAVIPLESEIVVPSINRGMPFMFQKESRSTPLAQAILRMVKAVKERLAQLESAQSG